jgi:hypothetical protein
MNAVPLSFALAVLIAVLPATGALAQADHADRIAGELALKRAQVRAAHACGRAGWTATTPATTPGSTSPPAAKPVHTPAIVPYPSIGTGGPVPAGTLCGG